MIPIRLNPTRVLAALLSMASVICIFSGSYLQAQDITAQPPAQLAHPAERLMMEQAVELSQAGETDEAVQLLEKLLDEAEDRLVAVPYQQRGATLTVQRYLPLAEWVQHQTRWLLQNFPQAVDVLAARHRGQAAVALEQIQTSKDLGTAQRLARRYGSTQWGKQFQLLVCDLFLERGWGLAAAQAAQPLAANVRVAIAASPTTADASLEPRAGTLPAPYAWHMLADHHSDAEHDQLWQRLFDDQADSAEAAQHQVEVARRLLLAAAMSPNLLDEPATRQWVEQLSHNLEASAAEELKQLLSQQAGWSALPQRSASQGAFPYSPMPGQLSRDSAQVDNAQRLEFVDWPAWSQSLEKYGASSDRVAASKPRVGETEHSALVYHPVVKDGRVFVNELTRIIAYDLHSGASWPTPGAALPLFDSQTSAASYLPLGYPMIGVPRGTLTIVDDSLYARLGSPITGRINSRTPAGGESASYLVGLDLSKQGSLLPGFPLHLIAPEFNNAEFDGPPLAWGEMLLVAVAERDHVGLRRSVAAFHRISGELLWKSGILAAGAVPGGERANLLAHQMLTQAGGRLYYNTNLGSIACLDPLSGATQWLVQYSSPADNRAFPAPSRYRYRDLTPCLISGGLVYCAAQDTPEIFALDALTGELIWSTDETTVSDGIQLLGTAGDSLLISGDRLIWLDKRSGALQASFPGNTTPLLAGALPSPRGLGRGTIAGQFVYWPTSGEILVFPAEPACPTAGQACPSLVGRLPMQPGGSAGGNVVLADDVLLVATPSRLMAFPAPADRSR